MEKEQPPQHRKIRLEETLAKIISERLKPELGLLDLRSEQQKKIDGRPILAKPQGGTIGR